MDKLCKYWWILYLKDYEDKYIYNIFKKGNFKTAICMPIGDTKEQKDCVRDWGKEFIDRKVIIHKYSYEDDVTGRMSVDTTIMFPGDITKTTKDEINKLIFHLKLME